MSTKLRYIGLDVHKETIVIAVAESGRGRAKAWKTIPYDLARLVKAMHLLAGSGELMICYEAGPTGFGVYRALTDAGYACQVVAPSLASPSLAASDVGSATGKCSSGGSFEFGTSVHLE